MKSTKLVYITVMALFVALGISVRLPAQEQQDEKEHKEEHHHYNLVDLGTLGGPQSAVWFRDFSSQQWRNCRRLCGYIHC